MFSTFGLLEPNNDLQIAYFGCVIALYFLSSFYDHHVHEKSSPNGTLSPIFKMVNENTKKIINSTDMSSQLKGTLNIPIGTILSTDIDVSQSQCGIKCFVGCDHKIKTKTVCVYIYFQVSYLIIYNKVNNQKCDTCSYHGTENSNKVYIIEGRVVICRSSEELLYTTITKKGKK